MCGCIPSHLISFSQTPPQGNMRRKNKGIRKNRIWTPFKIWDETQWFANLKEKGRGSRIIEKKN
jgi:hypothetical protein